MTSLSKLGNIFLFYICACDVNVQCNLKNHLSFELLNFLSLVWIQSWCLWDERHWGKAGIDTRDNDCYGDICGLWLRWWSRKHWD